MLVHVDLEGAPLLVGRSRARTRKGRDSASFEYDEGWLKHPESFALEPALQLGPGPHHTPAGKPILGAIGDSASDRWGRTLMSRAERRGDYAAPLPPVLQVVFSASFDAPHIMPLRAGRE